MEYDAMEVDAMKRDVTKRDITESEVMKNDARPSAWIAIVQQRCPRCRSGRIFRASIFRGFPRMFERCSVCNLKFEREAGYFLGAMYISYGMALGTIAIVAAILWSLTSWSVVKDLAWAAVLFLPFAPSLTLFARVLWIYLDQTMDPERPASESQNWLR